MKLDSGWCLILGASSGFGASAARAFAAAGLDIIGVHLDRKTTLPDAEAVIQDIEKLGRKAKFYNVNAVDAERRTEIIQEIKVLAESGPKVRVL